VSPESSTQDSEYFQAALNAFEAAQRSFIMKMGVQQMKDELRGYVAVA
jgi:hypothetical protein